VQARACKNTQTHTKWWEVAIDNCQIKKVPFIYDVTQCYHSHSCGSVHNIGNRQSNRHLSIQTPTIAQKEGLSVHCTVHDPLPAELLPKILIGHHMLKGMPTAG